MTQLIKDLLEFSTLANAHEPATPVDLNEVVQDVERDFELLIAEKKAVLTIGPLPTLPAVKLQMNQLFYNILGNALKFSREDIAPHIDITCRETSADELRPYVRKPEPGHTFYKISIRDNGIGFDPQFAEQIFEVFKRLHGRDTYAGSGIGLALCRRIAINHGGHLYGESAPGKGTTFHIILPKL
jgi:signal transduction histidine kinase